MASSQRRALIAGNWKMNLSLAQSAELARAVKDGASGAPGDVALCVPFTAIAAVRQVLGNSPVILAAQDVFWEAQGAFTGEVSAAMLVDAGCKAVIIGHSERRRLFGDTDAAVRQKLKAALGAGLIPIVCIGETLEERQAGLAFKVLQAQIEKGLEGFAAAGLAALVVAYEPVWAIGTGQTATPQQAQEAHLFIRNAVGNILGGDFAARLRLLYGGSVKAENVDALMSEPDIDGALVGGDSLKAASFLRIMHFKPAAAAK